MASVLENVKVALSDASDQAYDKVIAVLPEAGLAVLTVGVGLLVAALLHFLAVRIMEFFAIDKLAGKTPLDRMLKNVGIKKTISEIVALLLFWFVVFLTLVLAAEILDLKQLSHVLDVVMRFIPRIIVALLIVFFGLLLARFLSVLVEQPLRRAGAKYAVPVSKTVYTAVVVFVLLFAVDQLGLDLSFITTNVMIVCTGLLVIVGVGAACAARPLLENMLTCYQLRQLIKVGDRIKIDDIEGVVQEFTATSVILQVGDEQIIYPARDFFLRSFSRSRS